MAPGTHPSFFVFPFSLAAKFLGLGTAKKCYGVLYIFRNVGRLMFGMRYVGYVGGV